MLLRRSRASGARPCPRSSWRSSAAVFGEMNDEGGNNSWSAPEVPVPSSRGDPALRRLLLLRVLRPRASRRCSMRAMRRLCAGGRRESAAGRRVSRGIDALCNILRCAIPHPCGSRRFVGERKHLESLRAYRRRPATRPDEESRAWVHRSFTVKVRVARGCRLRVLHDGHGHVGHSLVRHEHPHPAAAHDRRGVLRGVHARHGQQGPHAPVDPRLRSRAVRPDARPAREGQEERDPRSGLFSYAYALRWQGRWNEAASSLRTLEDDDDPQSRFLYHNLMAYCAFDKRDLKGLTAEVKALKSFPARGCRRTRPRTSPSTSPCATCWPRSSTEGVRWRRPTTSRCRRAQGASRACRAVLAEGGGVPGRFCRASRAPRLRGGERRYHLVRRERKTRLDKEAQKKLASAAADAPVRA